MVWLAHMHAHSSDVAAHAVRVSVLAMVVGRHLGLASQQLETLGMCGLLHDVGKTRLAPRLLGRDAQLQESEQQEMKRHTHYGRESLLHDPLMPPVVLEAAYSHHERIDGKGYPLGIAADTLSYQTRVVAIVDTYDALCQKEGVDSAKALKRLYNLGGSQLDKALVIKFIEALGLYPAGSLVEMNSGEVGVVIETNVESRLKPKVALVLDKYKKPQPPFQVNLKTLRRDKVDLRIARALPDGSYGVNLQAFTEIMSAQ